MQQSPAHKNIVVFADGTGNGASALNKTNVWRLYRAVDLSDPPPDGRPRQVAFYIDGVGTSSFRPLALIGSIFGIGVARNAKEMYKFICRNYAPGDNIYAFGFSRGAFTARVLTSLIATQGVVQYTTEEELERGAADAYRAYRRRYKLPIFGRKDTTKPTDAKKRVGIVDVLRDIRDVSIRAWRRLRGIPNELPLPPHQADITFVGVWDTVSAYGLPIEELTRGIDGWVWPLSMPNYRLSERVRCARHALALDEERDSFQPLLWDEAHEADLEAKGAVPPGRMQQVWFAGVHANVGGGYADDRLSLVPLEWMMAEAAKAGLRYVPGHLREPLPAASPFGRRYDSRSGIAAYYRYQPRKLSARLLQPDPTARLQQNPSRRDRGFLRRIIVHESVFQRVTHGLDRYAPIGLPAEFEIVDAKGNLRTVHDPLRADRQEWVWNDVWRRRVNYFAILGLSLVLASLPLVQSYWPPSACLGPQCVLSPLLTGAGMFLPGFAAPWLDSFARAPGTAAALVIGIMALLGRSTSLEHRIRDGMREIWAHSLQIPLPGGVARTEAGKSRGRPRNWLYWFRTSRLYQRGFQYLKWWFAPAAFGSVLLGAATVTVGALGFILFGRFDLARREADGSICALQAGEAVSLEPGHYSTKQLCWPLGHQLRKGTNYRINIAVAQRWRDEDIATDPLGFGNERMPAPAKFGAYLVRRSAADRWFQPVLRITSPGGSARVQPLDFRCRCGAATAAGGPVTYTAEFTALADGEASLFINDAVIAVPFFSKDSFGVTPEFYGNNFGTASVELTPADDRP